METLVKEQAFFFRQEFASSVAAIVVFGSSQIPMRKTFHRYLRQKSLYEKKFTLPYAVSTT